MTINQFTSIIAKHDNELRNFAMKFTQDIDDANDLMQDTLVKAVRHFHQFQEDTNIKGWLYTIMRNTFINSYRKGVKSRDLITQSEDITYENLSYSATSNKAENNFVMGDIKGALDKLPAHLSIPFIRYVEGYKYHEISDKLNIPLGTVKTRIHEARKHLSKMLKVYKERIN
ncbi:sigma-70 family RNA polymerase sigma factor [Pedobacter psychrodurus]|uniref:Sigma-70 family RNA polymerase sigma factor n=1 Tax=Pedobacter psychrodurus TaxID=2530456 RepID=A0A4R0Q6W8_9SPHI|nr:sigma-70 family RNA polymerase sigma factor [Pedobacter psychrodurus]TCD28605.1 sigma-70 family RNA polymerase sigma factor [Pedobacter psychrodurus]